MNCHICNTNNNISECAHYGLNNTSVNTLTAQTSRELKNLIQSQCNFTGKKVISINGISLENRNDLAELKISNKNCTIDTYTSFAGHKTQFLNAPFNITIN